MRSPSEHIKLLQRRVDFLKSREHQNSYDLAEIGSLEWALANLPTKATPIVGLKIEDEYVRTYLWERALIAIEEPITNQEKP